MIECEFTPANSIELPGRCWVARDDLVRPCGICRCPDFEVVMVSRLVAARRLDPEHWSRPEMSIQCRNCYDPAKRPEWERKRIREEKLGSIDTRTGTYTTGAIR